NKPSSSTEESKSSSGTVREYSLEGGKEDLKTGSSVNNSLGGRELPADRQVNQAKSGSTEKNPSTIDRIQTKSNVRSTRATARNLRIDPEQSKWRVVTNMGFSDEEMVLELYKKMTDRAQKVTKYVLESGADEYTTVKARLIDHFHGDETVEKYLKKFEKASKKPGEKLCDFAIRLREIFKYAYPDAYTQDSFQIILQQKFIDGLDEKLQIKVKYKAFKTFDELVAEARKYSIRLETIEGSKGIPEFVNIINRPSNSKQRDSLKLIELKQLIENQHESVNAIAEKQTESVNALVADWKGESNQ
ncbi:hypothetical protein DAPPUDRAFT_121010, partial [Daphnia pulex]